jgi:hypothetical protein
MTRISPFLRLVTRVLFLLTLIPAAAVAQPSISVTPDTLTFDDLIVSQSQTLQVAIENTGTSLLTIHSIVENSPDFHVGGFAPVLNPGQVFQLQVTFEPQAVGSPSIPLVISSDASNGPNTFVFLEGNALPPAPLISSSTSALDFGTTVVGTVTPLYFTLSNTGTATLVIAGLTRDDAAFSIGPWQATIPPGESQQITVSFNPSAAQTYNATLTVESNAFNTPVLNIAATGAAVSYDVIVTPGAIGATLPEGGNTTELVLIANNGTVPFAFSTDLYDVASPGLSAPAFATAATLPAFFENFEDGNALGWTFVPGGSAARGVLPGSGANGSAFLYQEGLSVSGHHNGIYTSLPAVRSTEMGFWVRLSQTDRFAGYVTVRDAALREVIYFFAQSNGTFYCNASTGGDNSQPYNVFQWYHVEYRNIDWSTKTFDYYLDGALVTAGVSMRNAADVEDFSRIDVYSFSAGATAQWDDIFVSWGTAPPWLSATPASGSVAVSGTADITLDIDAAGLSHGLYEAALVLRTNDPATPLFEVPVTLTVDSTVTSTVTPRAPMALFQNAPNPFERGTTIRYALERPVYTDLRVYDVRGALVRTLDSGAQPAGDHQRFWDGRDNDGRRVASGVYFYRLATSGGFAQTRKMLMLR